MAHLVDFWYINATDFNVFATVEDIASVLWNFLTIIMTSQDKFSARLQRKKIRQKFKFGTLYFYYPTNNFNLIATVEDIMPGQYYFNTIIFTYR